MISVESLAGTQQKMPNGRWIPARPIPCSCWRCRISDAWAVFMGKAIAMTWPKE